MGVNKGSDALYHVIDLRVEDVVAGFWALYNSRSGEGLFSCFISRGHGMARGFHKSWDGMAG